MKKKVVFINNHFQRNDGTVKALIGICNNLDKRKFDITIISLYRCDRELEQNLSFGIKLKSFFGFYFRGFSKFLRIIPSTWLYKIVVKDSYDIEIAFQCDAPTRIIGHSLNKKAVHIIWMHGYDITDYDKKGFKSDYHVCVSKYNSTRLKQELTTNAKIRYCYNLIDDVFIHTKSKEIATLNHNNVTFVTVGRLSPEKGYIRLINILKELKLEGYQFTLYIVGDGPERNVLEQLVNINKLFEHIIFLGSQENPYKIVAKSDLFICSSYSEGYSTACTEAAILGIPIITTSVPGGAEIISEAGCGILSDLTDKSLKCAIKQVLDDPSILKEWKLIANKSSENFKIKARKSYIDSLFNEFYQLSDMKNI